MAKIKYTKNELKGQKDDLARFQRFLPTLMLKKQQLQREIHRLQVEREENQLVLEQTRDSLMRWVDVFGEEIGIEDLIAIREVITEKGNIAGIDIPMYRKTLFEERDYDFFEKPLWIDRAIEELKRILSLMSEIDTLAEAIRRLGEELRITTQRVNLFEKVKIPETKDNIRVIRIFLGDQETAAVVRGKIAKNKLVRGAA